VGGPVVARKNTVPSFLGAPIGPTSRTSSPIASVARAAQLAVTSLLYRLTPLLVVLHWALLVRPAVYARSAYCRSAPLSVPRVGGPSLVVMPCGDREHPIDTRAPLPLLADFPNLFRSTGALFHLRCPALAE